MIQMNVIFFFELIGTIAFAISGASVAIKKNMDVFGVIVLGTTTAVGGGIIRDILLGITPPMAFKNPIYTLIAIVISILVFGVREDVFEENRIVLLMDDIGLGVFTVVGVKAGIPFDNSFLCIFVGVLTGVGGGVLRDLFAGRIPSIFSKHFYACASICGAILSTYIWKINSILSMISGAVIVVLLRILAAKYRWNLPKANKV